MNNCATEGGASGPRCRVAGLRAEYAQRCSATLARKTITYFGGSPPRFFPGWRPPSGFVHANVLSKLLAPHGDIDRKRVTLLYRPTDSARAAHVVERDQNNSNVRITSSNRPSARSLVDARSAAQTAAEEAQGSGSVNFGLVVTATVNGLERLPDAVAAIEQTSGAARLLLRRAYGSQDTAFATSLPIGLVLLLWGPSALVEGRSLSGLDKEAVATLVPPEA